MAKGKKKSKKFDLSMTPFLFIGFVVVCVTALLQNLIPNFPAGLRNMLYIIGVLAMVAYMFQIAFEKRTGKRENDAPAKENKSKRLK